MATQTIALEGYRFSDGIDFTFPAQNLGPGEYVIVVANELAFVERYGEGHPIAGEYAQNLSNGGEAVAISGPTGNVVQSFTYGDDWLMETDGGGRSLEIVDDLLDAAAWDQAESWRASRLRDGSPGGPDVLLGDFNGDDQLNAADIDALMARIAAGDHLGSFDLTRDDRVDLDDRDAWLVVAGTLNQVAAVPYSLGDANLDGSVDGADFNLWNQHRFSAVTHWSQGNFNGDQGVDGRDFNLWNERKFVVPTAAQSAVLPKRVPKSAATVRQPVMRHEDDKEDASAPHEQGERDVMACTIVDVAVKVPSLRD